MKFIDLDKEYQQLKAKAKRMADALEIIANAPVPANEREMVSWILTARALSVEQLQQFKDGTKDQMYVCPCCKGDGKETCTNPDHGFIDSIPFTEIGRLGCPVCGHDPKYKVKNGGPCTTCDGVGKVQIDKFKEFCNETGYDDEPVDIKDGTKEVEPPIAPDLGVCKECGTRQAVTDYNGHQYYVCDTCDKRLNKEFDNEYK